MSLVPAIVANVILLASALGFGSLIHRLIPKSFSDLDRLTMTLLGGLGFLGTIFFCMGQFWFSRLSILFVLLSGILIGCVFLARVGMVHWIGFGNVRQSLLPASIVFIILLVTAVSGLARPHGDMNNDSIAYHYLGPKVWLREGLIRPVPDQITTYFPVVVETQYAALMSIGGERAPGFFGIVSLSLILLSAATLAIRLGLDASGAWWVVALICTMDSVYQGTVGGFLDAIFASFVLAAARLAFDAEDPGNFALFGTFCGLAMATKYTGLMVWPIAIFCSLVVSLWAYHRSLGACLKSLSIVCAAAIAVASPFYLRNWILYACPIYPPPPVLLHFFTPRNMLPSVIRTLVEEVRVTGGGMGRGVLAFFLLPFHMTYHASLFRGGGGVGIVPWALGPFGIVARRRDVFAKGLLLFAFLETAAWFVTAQESRYAIPMYTVAAVFGVLGWQYIRRTFSWRARALSAVVVAISILYGMYIIIPTKTEEVHAALSRPYETKWRLGNTLTAEGFDYMNGEPSVKRVLIMDSSTAGFFLDKPYVKPFGMWGERAIPGATDVPGVLAQLPNLNVSHVLDHRQVDGKFVLPEHPPGLTLVFERPDDRIYKVN